MSNEATAAATCRRCGVCCEKGGPGLHTEDQPLVESGRLPVADLFTLRKGELARDNVQGALAPLDDEIIKIKGVGGRWACRYYRPAENGCAVYAHRPLECRVLNCRQPADLVRIYQQDRLTRKHLLGGVAGLWDLVAEHEARCSYAELGALVRQGMTAAGQLRQEGAILERMRFDHHMRQLAATRGGLDAEMLDFLFGRPLSATIGMFELKLIKHGDTYALTHSNGVAGMPSGSAWVESGTAGSSGRNMDEERSTDM